MSRFSPTVRPEYYGPQNPGSAIAGAIEDFRQARRQEKADAEGDTQLDLARYRAGWRPGHAPEDPDQVPTYEADQAGHAVTSVADAIARGRSRGQAGPSPLGTGQPGRDTDPGMNPPVGIPQPVPNAGAAAPATSRQRLGMLEPGTLIHAAGTKFYALPHGGYVDESATPEARAESSYQAHTADERQYQGRVRQEGYAHQDTHDEHLLDRQNAADRGRMVLEGQREDARGSLARDLERMRGEYGVKEAGIRANATVGAAGIRHTGAAGTADPASPKALTEHFRMNERQQAGAAAQLRQVQRDAENAYGESSDDSTATRLQRRADQLQGRVDSLSTVGDLIAAARGGDPDAIAEVRATADPSDPTLGAARPSLDLPGYKAAVAKLEVARKAALAKGHPADVVARAYQQDMVKVIRKYDPAAAGGR